MTNNTTQTISTFTFRGFDLRCVMIDGDPWFAATDVCLALGISNASMATSKLSSTEVNRKKLSSATRARPNNMVNEAGLYKLIFQNRKFEARQFHYWVFGEVLPAIRKDGGYIEGEPVFEGGVVSIKIPGMGIVPWSEAVQRGLVKVSRYG